MFAAKSFTSRMLAPLVAGALCLSFQAKAHAAEKPLSAIDQDYTHQVTEEVLGEKKIGQMARDMAKEADVKHFAEEQVTGSEKMEKELHVFADKHAYVVPSKDADIKANEVRLEKAKAAKDFDKEYVAGEIRDHNNMIELFTKASGKVDNAELKTWLEDKATVLKTQLTKLQELSDKLNK